MAGPKLRKRPWTTREFVVTLLLSVILAVGLWLFAQEEVEVERPFDTTFVVRSEPGLVVAPDVMPVTLVLKGPQAVIAGLTDVHGEYVLDNDETDTKMTLPLDRKFFRVPSGIDVVAIEPEQVELDISRIDSKEVAVRLRLAGTPWPGYEVKEDRCSVSPEEVTIKGPRSVLSRPDAAEIFTMPIRVAFHDKSFTESTVPLDTRSVGAGVTTDETVSARIVIERKLLSQEFKDLPVKVLLPAGATFFPKLKDGGATASVTVSGPLEELATLKAEDILVYFRLDKVEKTPTYMDCEVILPPDKSLTIVGSPVPDKVEILDMIERTAETAAAE